MQVLLPYSSFEKSLDCLDDKTLRHQLLQCRQLIETIETIHSQCRFGRGKIAWGNHPTTKMWENNLGFLKCYFSICNYICSDRQLGFLPNVSFQYTTKKPWFLGKEVLHASHQSFLTRLPNKGDFYKTKFEVPNDLPLLYATKERGQEVLTTQ